MIEWFKHLLTENDFATGGLLVVMSSSAMYLLRAIPRKIWNSVVRFLATSYTVRSGDPMYPHVAAWCSSLRKYWKNSDIASSDDSLRGDYSYSVEPSADIKTGPGTGSHVCWLKFCPVVLNKTEKDKTGVTLESFVLTITVPIWKRKWLFKQFNKCLNSAKEKNTQNFTVHLPNSLGGWRKVNSPDGRSLKSVYSKATNIVENDIKKFLKSQSKYRDRGIPWRRGYLFHGPPGTGKTSLALAIATEFKLNCYILPLGSIEKDTTLIDLVSGMGNNSILVLEDIDRMNIEKISMSGVLNCIDGIASRPAGSIMIMTTNNKEKLDPALIRPGRIDLALEMKDMDQEQVDTMIKSWGRETKIDKNKWVGKTPAELQQYLQEIDSE